MKYRDISYDTAVSRVAQESREYTQSYTGVEDSDELVPPVVNGDASVDGRKVSMAHEGNESCKPLQGVCWPDDVFVLLFIGCAIPKT